LKGFLEYVGLSFDISINRPKLLPEFVNTEDISKLRDTLKNHKTHKSSVFRDLVLVDTAIKTGLRRSELANLLVCHVDIGASRLIVVAGKGRKDRVIPLCESLRQDLEKLTHDKRPNESVFGLNYRSLGMKIKEWSNKAGVPIHTHSFRHYFATKLVEKGANIRVVQELLGHSSLNTTQVYLSVTANHLKEAIGLLDE
jgi:integrase/recombinase XerD